MDLTEFPHPEVLGAFELLDVAEHLFNEREYGAALYYSTLAYRNGLYFYQCVEKNADLKNAKELTRYYHRAKELRKTTGQIIRQVRKKDLTQIIVNHQGMLTDEGFNVRLNSAVFEKKCKHIRLYRALSEEYGYKSRILIKNGEILTTR